MENARKSLYLIVMTHSEVHIQRVDLEPEAPVLIDLVLPNSRSEHGNLECEKGLLGFGPDRIGTLVPMETDSSHMVIMGENILLAL